MALIPTQHVEPRDTLSVRIDRAVHERLRHYAEFIESPKEYVLTQALERLFRSDKSFQAWLVANTRAGERGNELAQEASDRSSPNELPGQRSGAGRKERGVP